MHVHKVNFDAPNTYICIFATECNIQILIQFAKVRNAFQTRRALGLVNQFLDKTVFVACA